MCQIVVDIVSAVFNFVGLIIGSVFGFVLLIITCGCFRYILHLTFPYLLSFTSLHFIDSGVVMVRAKEEGALGEGEGGWERLEPLLLARCYDAIPI